MMLAYVKSVKEIADDLDDTTISDELFLNDKEPEIPFEHCDLVQMQFKYLGKYYNVEEVDSDGDYRLKHAPGVFPKEIIVEQ